ncbi:Hypothetical protein GLP15_3583 [Giardia lamblia P15]|uniref:Uncharacterized protein n=1 Tax=Giardia intestinalis (strain P15) TaxID=658858 RepID=E1F438_GIAIA|nr:Hypothetical protein GLP15_3583 [Giardia lamblia P15]
MTSQEHDPLLRQAPTLSFDPLTNIEWKLIYELNYELDDRMQSMTFRHLETSQQPAPVQQPQNGSDDDNELAGSAVGVVRLGMRFPTEYYKSLELPAKGEADVMTLPTPIEISTMAGQSIIEHLTEIRKSIDALPISYFTAPSIDLEELRKENAIVEEELRAEIEKTHQFAKELDDYRRRIALRRFASVDKRAVKSEL